MLVHHALLRFLLLSRRKVVEKKDQYILSTFSTFLSTLFYKQIKKKRNRFLILFQAALIRIAYGL